MGGIELLHSLDAGKEGGIVAVGRRTPLKLGYGAQAGEYAPKEAVGLRNAL